MGWDELARKTAESHTVCARHGIATSEGNLAVDCNSVARALAHLEAELARVNAEREALQRHFDAAAPEHNLPALLDLYLEEQTKAEAERDEAEEDGIVLDTVASLLLGPGLHEHAAIVAVAARLSRIDEAAREALAADAALSAAQTQSWDAILAASQRHQQAQRTLRAALDGGSDV